MEPGTFEEDEDRRTERTVIGAELTGRVNGLRLLIMRGRGCADCEKACDRKRRDGRTAHPNCPFNPLRLHHSRTCNAASVGWWIVPYSGTRNVCQSKEPARSSVAASTLNMPMQSK